MNVTKSIKKLEHSAVELTVTIPQADVADGYNKLLAKYAKSVQIPGFRKGHVPTSVLERKFGESLKGEAAADLIEQSLDEIFKDESNEQPLPYSQPTMEKAPEINLDSDLTYTVTYDVMPQVTVGDFSDITIEVPDVTIGETELNEELKAVQERNALVVDKKDNEKAAKDDIATINYCELDDTDTVIAGSERQDFVFTIGSGQDLFELDDDVIGMKKGDTKDVTKTYAENHTNSELAGTTKKVRVTLTALKVRNLPELDDELAQDVNEKYKTLDDLKADITKNLNAALENRIKEIKSNALVEKLVEKNPIDLPKSMCTAELESRWRMMAQQFQTTPEQLEKLIVTSGSSKENMMKEWEADSQKALKGRIIVENLFKEYNITITPEDVDAEYAKIAENASISVEEVKKHYADLRRKEYLIDDMKEQKLYEELFKKVTFKKGEKKIFADLFKN